MKQIKGFKSIDGKIYCKETECLYFDLKELTEKFFEPSYIIIHDLDYEIEYERKKIEILEKIITTAKLLKEEYEKNDTK